MNAILISLATLAIVGVGVVFTPQEVAADCGGRFQEDCDFDDDDLGQPPYTEQDRQRAIADCLDYLMEEYGGDLPPEQAVEAIPSEAAQRCYDANPPLTPTPSGTAYNSNRQSAANRGAALYAEAQRADAWAEEHLAAERAQAMWWRNAFVDLEGKWTIRAGKSTGQLLYLPDLRKSVSYVCDANYDVALSGGCVPADRDYDCLGLRSWGIVNIPVIGDDWMLLDEDKDKLGCEWPDA